MEDERFSAGGDDHRSRLTDAWWGVHVARYAFALRHLGPAQRVADIASGTGYGAALLAAGGHQVVGVDVDLGALRGAREAHRPVSFVAGAGEALPFSTGSFDAVTSFETIEHLHHREAFVAELARVIRPGGQLLLSTPNAWYTHPGPDGPTNPYHLHEYEPPELKQLLQAHFSEVELLGQQLSPRFRTSPFHEDQERLPKRLGPQVRLYAWKAMNQLPVAVRSALSKSLFRREFLPGEDDYEFSTEVLPDAPVAVAVVRR